MNFINSLISLSKAGIGTGLLFTPFIFLHSGIFGALSIIIVSILLIYSSYNNLATVLNNTHNYRLDIHQVVKLFLKEKYELFILVNFDVYNMGANTSYIIFIIKSFYMTISLVPH